jgi:hypothetical protein
VYFPHSASPKFRFNEEYPGDITASSRGAAKSHRLSIERLDEFKEDEELGSAPSNLHQPVLSTSNVARRGPPPSSTLSSIDAFEASFNLDFPDNFSPKGSGPKERVRREEIYNPFSYSPGTPREFNRSSPPYAAYVSPSDPPGHVSPQRTKPPMRKPSDGSKGLIPRFHLMGKKDQLSGPNQTPTSTSSRTPLAGSGAFLLHTPPPPSSPPSDDTPESSESSSSPALYSTPPPPGVAVNYNPSPAIVIDGAGSAPEQPKRPEKTGHETARARREKVLQPRLASVSRSSPSQPAAPPTATPAPPPPQPSPPQDKKIVKALDPRSREAILLSARERLSSSSNHQSKVLSSSLPSPLLLLPPPPPENYPNHASVLWGGLYRGGGSYVEEDDGDIPLRSSLTKTVLDGRAQACSGRSPPGKGSALEPPRTAWRSDGATEVDGRNDLQTSTYPRLRRGSRSGAGSLSLPPTGEYLTGLRPEMASTVTCDTLVAPSSTPPVGGLQISSSIAAGSSQ